MPRGGQRSTTRKPGHGGPASGIPASGIPASNVPASGVPASGIPAKGASTAQKAPPIPDTDDSEVQRERAMLGTLKGNTVKQQKKLLEEFMVMNVAAPAVQAVTEWVNDPTHPRHHFGVEIALSYSINKPKQEIELSTGENGFEIKITGGLPSE